MRAVISLLTFAAFAAAQQPPALVEVAKVEKQTVAAGRTFVGTIRPYRESVVGAEVAGRVAEMLVRDGDAVQAGQPMARLNSRIIEARINSAEADRKLRQAELLELRNGTRPEELAQARARVARDKAEVEYRRWQSDRSGELYERNSTTAADVEETKFALKAAEGRLAESEAALKLAEEGPRKERIAQAEAAVASREAVLAQLREELAQHTVDAPYDGWVVAKRAEIGQWVGAGDPVATVASLATVELVVSVPQDAIAGIRVGQKVDVATTGLMPGEVVAIVPEADLRGRTFPVVIRVENRVENGVPHLKAGMLARVSLAIGEPEPTLLVPKDAIVLGERTPFVWVVGEDGSGRKAPVEVGAGYGAKIGIRGEIAEGDTIVVRGNERIRPGQAIRVKE